MNEEEVRKWLDDNNKQLLLEVEKIVPVKFSLWDNDHFACQVHKNDQGVQCEAEIFYIKPPAQSKIAHELLHAKTSLILGDNGIMFSISNQSAPFIWLMKHENASNIVNLCEHVIFFPDYLDMGYSEEDSFEQPRDLVRNHEKLFYLEKHGLKEKGRYDIRKVFDYLGLVFTFLFYPNEKRFHKEVKTLKKIDFPLFSRVYNLKRACTDLDITPANKDYLQQEYFNFAKDINGWFSKAFDGAVFF